MISHRAKCDLLVVSHPAVLPVNQLVYAELARRGFRVELVVPGRWRHEYADAPFDATPLPELAQHFHRRRVLLAGQPQRHLYLANPIREIRRRRPAIVFCEQEPFAVPAAQWGLAAHALGIPFGVQMDENLDRPLQPPARLIRSAVLPRAAFIAARSDTAAQLARKWGALHDVRLIPHHIPGWPLPERGPRDRFTVGYAGRLVPEKGLDTLAAAARRLDPPVELLVAGDGPLRGWLESVDLGVASLRIVRGIDHAEMARVYAEMDALVLPSRTTPRWVEQFGRVLVEAMWCGTPVIGSDSGEIPWVIETTGGGLVFPEGDAAALAERLSRLRHDSGLRDALAERGRAQSVALFGVEAVADRFEEVLHDVVGVQRPQRSPRSKKPVVALVAHGVHDHGGMERACAELIRRARDQVDFVVVAAELAPELRPLVHRWVRVRVPPRPIPLKFVLFWLQAGLTLRRVDADLVHTVGAIAPSRVDLAAVYHCHAGQRAAVGGFAPATMPGLWRLNTSLSRRIALLAERICYRPSRVRALAASNSSLGEEVQLYYPNIPISIVPNGVDTAITGPDAASRDIKRKELSVGPDATVALFLGGDWHRKGLPLILKALSLVENQQNLVLWVVGHGDQAEMSKIANDLQVSDRVRFVGPVPDTAPIYQAADLFVLASSYETFSISCFEAAATGLPVIVTDVHGAAELVRDGGGGILVERTPESVASALDRLARSPQLRREQGAEACRRASTFTWQRSVDSMMDLYHGLLDERKPGQ